MMEAIILAGGFGTRLRQVVPDLPKPMAPVAGRPFLEIILSALSIKGFTRIILSIGYLADKIVNHFGSCFAGMDIVYEIEQAPLGTGGAARRALEQCISDHVFIFNGDTYLDLAVPEVEALWQHRRMPIIVAREVNDIARYGGLEIADGKVRRFIEKGKSGPGLINAGCYVLPRHILDGYIPGRSFSLETDFFAAAVRREPFVVYVSDGKFIDIGIPDDYARAQIELANVHW